MLRNVKAEKHTVLFGCFRFDQRDQTDLVEVLFCQGPSLCRKADTNQKYPVINRARRQIAPKSNISHQHTRPSAWCGHKRCKETTTFLVTQRSQMTKPLSISRQTTKTHHIRQRSTTFTWHFVCAKHIPEAAIAFDLGRSRATSGWDGGSDGVVAFWFTAKVPQKNGEHSEFTPDQSAMRSRAWNSGAIEYSGLFDQRSESREKKTMSDLSSLVLTLWWFIRARLHRVRPVMCSREKFSPVREGAVFFLFGGGGGGGGWGGRLGLWGCIVFSKVLTLPLGPEKAKHDPPQKIT